MTRLLTFLLTICFCTFEAQIIEQINHKVGLINAVIEPDLVTTDENGQISHFSFDELYGIRLIIEEEGVEKTVFWVFESESLIFAEHYWRKGMTKAFKGEKFYLQNERLIAWLDDQEHPVNASETLAMKITRELLIQSQKMKTL
jgi:hypothetical protein